MLLTPLYVPTIVPTQMASLTRKERSPYWYCCFTRPDGTRTKVSTKQTNRNDAMAVCLEWELAATKAGHGALTETQAQKVVSDIVERVSGQPLVFHTVTEWMRFWLKGKQQTRECCVICEEILCVQLKATHNLIGRRSAKFCRCDELRDSSGCRRTNKIQRH